MYEKKKTIHGFQKKRKPQSSSHHSRKPKPQIQTENSQVGVYQQGKGNFGFVDTIEDGKKVGYYVHESKKADALPGDEVFFETKIFRGKPEAMILGVSKRAETLIVGTLQIQNTFGFVVTESQYIKTDIFIPGKFLKGFQSGDRVGVQVIRWEGKKPEGRIVEKIPKIGEKGADIFRIAVEGGARITFPEAVMQEVRNISPEISEAEIGKRKDLRNLLTFTIDGADSKDLDDALSVKKMDNGDTLLFVHIADVAHFVREKSALDTEALKRATSIYLVNKVIPMLPPELSNGLCSLHPGEPKLTLTCEMLVNAKGHILKSDVYESIIESDYRLTYKDVQEFLDSVIPAKAGINKKDKVLGLSDRFLPSQEGRNEKLESHKGSEQNEKIASLHSQGQESQELDFGGLITPELKKNIIELQKLKKILETYKDQKGVLHFDFPETKIEVDENEFPIRFYEYERYESHKIIEECMILANEAIAMKFHKLPFLYRVHENPDEEDVEKFGLLLKKFDLDVEISDISSRSFQSILTAIEAHPKAGALQKMLLRTLMKARYSEKNFGHFGLASSHYSHFTSPIRRYPDLQIHRIMKETLQHSPPAPLQERGGATDVSSLDKGRLGGGLSLNRKKHYEEILPQVALQSSNREQLSEKLEYRVKDFMAVQFMKDKVGQRFTAKVSGMIEKGFFIELPNTIEGFVDFGISTLTYDEENFSIISKATGKDYTFGDEVEVELIGVDTQRLRLDFEMVNS